MASTLDISLPEPLKAFVEAQTEAGHYASPADYIGELVLQEADRQYRIEVLLLESVDDPRPPLTITAEQVTEGNLVDLIRDHLATHG